MIPVAPEAVDKSLSEIVLTYKRIEGLATSFLDSPPLSSCPRLGNDVRSPQNENGVRTYFRKTRDADLLDQGYPFHFSLLATIRHHRI